MNTHIDNVDADYPTIARRERFVTHPSHWQDNTLYFLGLRDRMVQFPLSHGVSQHHPIHMVDVGLFRRSHDA